MQTITGTYCATIQKNITTGTGIFSIRPADNTLPLTEYGTLLCEGELKDYPKGLPVTLTGELDDTGLFHVASCTEGSDRPEEVIEFLAGGLFPGIGPKTARRIMDAFEGDVFGGVKREDAEEILEQAGIREENAMRIISVIREFGGMKEILALIRAYGGTYMDAYLLHKAYGRNAEETVKNHPYAPAAIGTAYEVCEKMARAFGVCYYDTERILALLREAFRLAESEGHTAMTLTQLIEVAGRAEEAAGCGYNTPVYFLCGHLTRDEFTIFEHHGEVYVQRTEQAKQENLIATRIRALEDRTHVHTINHDRIARLEKELDVTYSDEQKKAFRLLAHPGLKILTGGPGTGKTTLLHGMIAYYKEVYAGPVQLCSPTAAAAQRMREATGYPAETVHRALGLLSGGQRAQSRRHLERGLVIVDEVSMLDTEIFSILLDQVVPGSFLLLVGDEEQLESVGPGNVLSDLLKDAKIPAVRLQKVYRQKLGSSILENGFRIRCGQTDLIFDQDSERYQAGSTEQLTESALTLMKRLYDRHEPYRTRLLTPVRSAKYPYGVTALNRALQAELNPDTGGQELLYGENIFRTGDPVQMMKNNYKSGYINGDIGIIEAVHTDSGGTLEIKLEGKEEHLMITGGDLADVALAYAQTVHKAQGGECETCIIILPEKPRAMVYKKILYVAATRARKKNLYIIQRDALTSAITNTGHRKRITGLNYQLEQT